MIPSSGPDPVIGHVLVVGAGIAGCSLTLALARRGVHVTLIERGHIGRQGASAVEAALLNPYRGRSARPGPLDLAGLAAFWDLVAELEQAGLDSGATRGGVLRLPSSERQARGWQSIAGLVRLETVPAPYRAPHGAFLVEDGGWVSPGKLLAALAAAARSAGAEVLEERGLERIERAGHRLVAVTSGGELRADGVVVCTGADPVPGIALPELERYAGDQITLRSRVALPYPLAGSVYLAASGERVMIGGNHRPANTEDRDAPRLLQASAARMVPLLAEARLERVWSGVRARRPDRVPLATEVGPNLWFLGAFGGRGFLTAPLLAGRLAVAIAGRLRTWR